MKHTKEEEALMSQIANLEIKLRGMKGQLEDLRIQKTGIQIGQIAVTTKGRFRIVKIEPIGSSVWLVGNPTKKDGTFGVAERRIYGDYTIEPGHAVEK